MLLAVIVLVGVLWDSAAVAIMVTFAIMIITPILAQKTTIERLLSSEWSRNVVRVLYYALPKTSDISVIIRHMILNQPDRKLDAGLEHGAVWRGGAGAGLVALPAKKFLMRCGAAPSRGWRVLRRPTRRIDNVLMKMVPPGATSLVGAHMDLIRQTEIYRRMVAERKLPDLDQFAAETGFDPRRDVRELLYVTTPGETNVMLARGTFQAEPFEHAGSEAGPARRIQHLREFPELRTAKAGFASSIPRWLRPVKLPAIEAALDEWKSGSHHRRSAAAGAGSAASPATQFWGISTGVAGFLAEHMPRANNGVNFSRIFRGLEDTWFEADFSAGLRAYGSRPDANRAGRLESAGRGQRADRPRPPERAGKSAGAPAALGRHHGDPGRPAIFGRCGYPGKSDG